MTGKIDPTGYVLGVDFNKDCLNCARERKKVLEEKLKQPLNCEFYESDVLSLPAENRFDLIYL